jgi:predicted dehydrogenase
MGELLEAVATGGRPATSVCDNLDTMALVEACYRSVQSHRPVAIAEVKGAIP